MKAKLWFGRSILALAQQRGPPPGSLFPSGPLSPHGTWLEIFFVQFSKDLRQCRRRPHRTASFDDAVGFDFTSTFEGVEFASRHHGTAMSPRST